MSVLDGADGLLLSNETCNGSFPVASIEACSRQICEAEKCVDHKTFFNDIRLYTA